MQEQGFAEELRQQLEQARAADPEFRQVGAWQHRYCWNPPASLEQVEALEQKIGVSLPEGYRDFVLQVGNGGAGPFCGLFSLDKVGEWLNWAVEPKKLPILDPKRGAKEREPGEKKRLPSGIPIGSDEDTYFLYLLVAGPHRGRVFYGDYDGGRFFYPREQDFLTWYRRWLREVRNHYRITWFATNLDGDEAELQAHYQQTDDKKEKQYVLKSMTKFPALAPDTVNFLKEALWEQRDMEDAREILTLLYRVDPELLERFLESRWQAGRYGAVVRELNYADAVLEEDLLLPERWWQPILDKLPQLEPEVRRTAVALLGESGMVKLGQVLWVYREEQDSARKWSLLQSFPRFLDTGEELEFWLGELAQREDLELLQQVILYLPNQGGLELIQALNQIEEEFAFAVEEILHVDRRDPAMVERAERRRKEYRVYLAAHRKQRTLTDEWMWRRPLNIPRPYEPQLNACDRTNLFLDQEPPENGIPIHPLIALAIRTQFHALPSTAYDWHKVLGKVKRLDLRLNSSTVRRWDDEARVVDLVAADDYPLPAPFYYSLKDWSAIGRMKNLRDLSISEICVGDFSFLKECPSLTQLSLYHTDFTDCSLLLELPKLKRVDLRQCRLEHREALEGAPFSYQLGDEEEQN